MKLSEKLIKLRKEKGLSQEEFGNEINVSRQAVSKWENDESIPDTEKIKEIVKKFNLSYEYLLNDEIEEMQEFENNSSESTIKNKKHKGKIILKILLFILMVYVFTCVYKFIVFYRFYLVANSFSEENYSISQTHNFTSSDGTFSTTFDTKKVGNQILSKTYINEEPNAVKNEKGNIIPYSITFFDKNKDVYYSLDYDNNMKKYVYHDNKKNFENKEDIEVALEAQLKNNLVKDTTLTHIPSGFKSILLASIDPTYYYVDFINNEYRKISIFGSGKTRIKLTKDCLVEQTNVITEFDGSSTVSYSYDYVQDHFSEIESPVEQYKDKIVYDE